MSNEAFCRSASGSVSRARESSGRERLARSSSSFTSAFRLWVCGSGGGGHEFETGPAAVASRCSAPGSSNVPRTRRQSSSGRRPATRPLGEPPTGQRSRRRTSASSKIEFQTPTPEPPKPMAVEAKVFSANSTRGGLPSRISIEHNERTAGDRHRSPAAAVSDERAEPAEQSKYNAARMMPMGIGAERFSSSWRAPGREVDQESVTCVRCESVGESEEELLTPLLLLLLVEERSVGLSAGAQLTSK